MEDKKANVTVVKLDVPEIFNFAKMVADIKSLNDRVTALETQAAASIAAKKG